MAHDELSMVVDRGWELLSLASGLFAEITRESGTESSTAETGRRLIVLAEGLGSCGQANPARLAQSLAEVFVELAELYSRPNDAVMELLQTALGHFSDLLVELDATGQTTAAAPVELLNKLDSTAARLRMVRLAEDRSNDTDTPDTMELALELHRNSESLVATSDALWNRMQYDGDSPYMATVSRIHFLATTQRDLLTKLWPQVPAMTFPAEVLKEMHPLRCEQSTHEELLVLESLPERSPLFGPVEENCSATELGAADISSGRASRVLIIDESPFIRMLLGTAVESLGYPVETTVSLDEAMLRVRPEEPCGVVIWNADCFHSETVRLTEWLRRQTFAVRPALIAVIDKNQAGGDFSPEYDWVVNRDDVIGLLSVISGALTGKVMPTRMSA